MAAALDQARIENNINWRAEEMDRAMGGLWAARMALSTVLMQDVTPRDLVVSGNLVEAQLRRGNGEWSRRAGDLPTAQVAVEYWAQDTSTGRVVRLVQAGNVKLPEQVRLLADQAREPNWRSRRAAKRAERVAQFANIPGALNIAIFDKAAETSVTDKEFMTLRTAARGTETARCRQLTPDMQPSLLDRSAVMATAVDGVAAYRGFQAGVRLLKDGNDSATALQASFDAQFAAVPTEHDIIAMADVHITSQLTRLGHWLDLAHTAAWVVSHGERIRPTAPQHDVATIVKP